MTSSSTPKISVALVGGTGLTGSYLVQQLVHNPSVSRVISLARRPPLSPINDPENKLTWHVEKDSSQWPSTLSTLLTSTDSQHPPVKAFLSALGTTQADAGSIEAQRQIDYGLNLSLATAARKIPSIDTYALVSVDMADPNSRFAYVKMKGELERDVVKLGFEKTAIIRPGFIVGNRKQAGFGEQILHWAEKGVRCVLGGWATEGWAQPAWWIARAAVRAAVEPGVWEGGELCGVRVEEGKEVWRMPPGEIVRLAKEAGEKL